MNTRLLLWQDMIPAASKQQTLTQCWFNVGHDGGPTLNQHWVNVRSIRRVQERQLALHPAFVRLPQWQLAARKLPIKLTVN